jgi:hypothetical protein
MLSQGKSLRVCLAKIINFDGLKNIFLAGGLSENKYLFNEVKKFADGAGIQVQQADDWYVNQ